MGRLQKCLPILLIGSWFSIMIVSFAVQKLWSLIRSHLSILAFVANAFSALVIRSLPMPIFWMILPRYSSRVFMVLGLMFKILIHLELILVLGVRKGSSFCFLHMASQFSQHHILNRNPFPIACFCQVCQKLDGCRRVVLPLNDHHSNRCEMVSKCGFYLHFSNDQW